MLTQITDHVTRAIARLKSQFQDSDEFKAMIAALVIEIQVFEDAQFKTFQVLRDPAACVALGASSTLIELAKLVQARARGTLDDTRMADLIASQVQVNRAQGTPEDLIAVYTAFFNATQGPPLFVTDADQATGGSFPAGLRTLVIEAELANGLFDTPEAFRNGMALIAQATPAGNRTILICAVAPTNDTNTVFVLDSSNTDDVSHMVCAFDSPDSVR